MTSAILVLMVDAVSSVDLQVRIFLCYIPPTTTPAIRSLGGSSLTHICVSSSHLGISDAYYCAECTRLEKDRDGCPKIVNLGASRTDLFYERRRLGAFVPRAHYFSFVYV